MLEEPRGYSERMKLNVCVLKGHVETRDMRHPDANVLLEVGPEMHDWMQGPREVKQGEIDHLPPTPKARGGSGVIGITTTGHWAGERKFACQFSH